MHEEQPNTDWMPDLDWVPDYAPPAANDKPTREDLRKELENAPVAKKVEDSDHADRSTRKSPKRPIHGENGNAGTEGASPPIRGSIRTGKGDVLKNCPVTALGVRGDFAFFLDANGQIRQFKKLDLQAIQSLFAGQIDYVCFHFPKWRKSEDGVPQRVHGEFHGTAISKSLWDAAGELRVFDPVDTVRGVGAWSDDEGNLTYHMGDCVLYKGERVAPGIIDGKIYPAAAAIPKPLEGGPDPAPDILKTIETWNWTSPDLHPFTALGMICCQMMCGALRWRPTFWITAPAASGKSAFQEMIKLLHGEGGLIQSTDASKSGITSRVKQSSLPVALDEVEPEDERGSTVKAIITLARVASSGGEWSRGSADQSAVGGKVYSSFLFSSILIPGIMKTQDVQRLIRLDMRKIESGAGLSLTPKTWRARGARLKNVLIMRWESLPERVGRWRHALESEGVTGRNADNWEIVLAMADMALNEDLPAQDVCTAWAKKVRATVAADKDDVSDDSQAMVAHLLGQTLDPFRRGQQYTVGQWIMVAAGLPGAPNELLGDFSTELDGKEMRKKKANELLAAYGLRIYSEHGQDFLFIANKGPANMARLFEGSDWHSGVWRQSAERIPGAYKLKGTKSLAGLATRGTMVPVLSIPSLLAFPDTKTTMPEQATQLADQNDITDLI